MGIRRRIPDLIEHRRTRAESEVARIEARAVIERWSQALAAGRGTLWSPTIRAAVLAGTPWLDVHCPGRRTKPRDQHSHHQPPSARVGWEPGTRLAVFVVRQLRADAADHGPASVAPGNRRAGGQL